MRKILKSDQWKPERCGPRGSMLVEAALVISLVLVPMLLGVSVYGLNFIRLLQVNQVNRDAGHMFARGLDLSGVGNGLVNQSVITQLSPALTNGTGVLVLSAVEYIGDLTCPSGCTNKGSIVFTQQIVIPANNAVRKAAFTWFGSSGSFRKDPVTGKNDGTGVVGDPLGDANVIALSRQLHPNKGTTYLAMTDVSDVANGGTVAYIAEAYFKPAMSIPGFPSPAIISARAFF